MEAYTNVVGSGPQSAGYDLDRDLVEVNAPEHFRIPGGEHPEYPGRASTRRIEFSSGGRTRVRQLSRQQGERASFRAALTYSVERCIAYDPFEPRGQALLVSYRP
jgi:hypothetical protein